MDVEGFRHGAAVLDHLAVEVRAVATTVTALPESSWCSESATQFRARTAELAVRIAARARALEEAANVLRRQARTVEEMSHRLEQVGQGALGAGEEAVTSLRRWVLGPDVGPAAQRHRLAGAVAEGLVAGSVPVPRGTAPGRR